MLTSATKPVLKGFAAPALHPLLGFDLRSLFANGEAGALYTPWDLSTMFQDAAGTTPAAIDSPVGLLVDQSGNGNDASQSTDAARPILRETAGGLRYLEFDGVDDFFNIPGSASALKFLHDGSGGASYWAVEQAAAEQEVIWSTTINTKNVGATLYVTNSGNLRNAIFNGTGTSLVLGNGANTLSTDAHVISTQTGSSRSPNYEQYFDGATDFTSAYTGSPSTSDADNDIDIGKRGESASLYWAGKMFGGVFVASLEGRESVEAELAKRAGVTL